MNDLIRIVMHNGIEVPVFKQDTIFRMYEHKKISVDELRKLDKETLIKYVNALWLCTCENANDWSEGIDLLKEVGFIEVVTEYEDGKLINLVYEKDLLAS